MEILNQRIVDESARVEEVRKRLAVVDSEIERKRKEKESELIQKIETNGGNCLKSPNAHSRDTFPRSKLILKIYPKYC